MKKDLLRTIAATAVFGTMSLPAMAQDVQRVEMGVLECAVKGGTGFIFGSTKDLSCTFRPNEADRAVESYFGAISKYGLDIGTTKSGVISWLVLAPTKDMMEPGALKGDYAGVSAEATVGAGLGANILVGGSSETIALQPLSVSSQTGLNFAVAISELELRSAAD